jgi:pimeloyl-ACP methyl ester carboxylesterase
MEATINGGSIYYEREGEGLSVIFLHEGVADSRMWEPQVDAFAKHFDVVRPDMRGFGQSSRLEGPWSPVADLLALIDELELKPAHIVGASAGGGIAIDFALEHPERISKLVLVGSAIGGTNFGKRYPDLFKDIRAADEAKDFQALNRAEMRLFLDGPRRPEGYVSNPKWRELFLDMNAKTMYIDWAKSPPKELDPPAAERLGEISAPTLVVIGDEDIAPVQDGAELLMEKVPHARKAVIHDAAHLPNLEHPEEFNRIVLEFLLEN